MAYKLVGYYENWAQYRPEGKGKFLPDQIDPSLLTHINFAFGFFGFITRSVDPKNPRLTGNYKIEPVEWNDQTVLYPALQKLKQKNPNLKTLLSIGGWSFNDPQDTNGIGTFTYKLFSQMASSAAGRKQFIDSAIAYAHKYGFDGIDLDWEYPGDRARGGTDSDYDNFLALLKEFRSAINNDKGQKLLLTIASPAIKKGEAKTSEQFFAWLAQCAGYLDWLNVMTYDYHGAFPDDKVTGVNAPLLQDSTPGGTFSVRHTVEAYLAGGIPKEKMVLGMPTYGRTFKVTSPLTDTDNGPGKPYSGPGAAGKATQTPGFLAYYEILERLSSGDLKRGWDQATLTPYAYSKNGEWITYDDAESLGYKVSYLIEKDLAGAMVWAIDNDDFFNAGSLKQENVSRALVSNLISSRFPLISGVQLNLLHPETRRPLPRWSKDELVPDIGLSKSPAVAVFNGQVYCVHEGYGDDGNLWYSMFDGKVWSKDTKLSARGEGEYGTTGTPALVVFNNKLYCFHQGRELKGQLWYTTFDGNRWSKDQFVPDIGLSQSPAVAVFNGKLYCVHEGMKDEGWLWYTTFDGNNWTTDTKLSARGEGDYGTTGTPALVVFNNKLYCFHQGREFKGQLWYTTFDGNRWSKDQFVPDIGLSKSPAVAVFNGQLYCFHEGMGDQGWLWYTTFDGNSWTTDIKLSDRGTSGTPALAVFNNKLYCFHQGRENKGQLWVTILSHQGWHQLRGANSYCHCACHSHDLKQKTSHSHKMKIDEGAPYFYAVLTKNDESFDFPTGAVLEIKAPDGTVYNREVNEKNLLVMMYGSSIQCLIVKDPMPGYWLMSMTAPEGIDFHCECNTIPSKDVYDTVTTTLRSSDLTTRLQKRDLVIDDPLIVTLASGWMGLAGIAGIFAKSAFSITSMFASLAAIPALPALATAAGVGILAGVGLYWWLNPQQQQQQGLELIQAAKGKNTRKQTAAVLTTKAQKVNDNSKKPELSKDLKDAINEAAQHNRVKIFSELPENNAMWPPFLIAFPNTLLGFDTFSDFIAGLRTIFMATRTTTENFAVQVTLNQERSAWIRVDGSNLYLTGSNNESHDINANGWDTIQDVNYRNMERAELSLDSIGNAAIQSRRWTTLPQDRQHRTWGLLAFVISEAARFEVIERVVNTIFDYSIYPWIIFQPILTSWRRLSNQMQLVPVPLNTTREFAESTTEYNDETRNRVIQIHDELSNQQNNLG